MPIPASGYDFNPRTVLLDFEKSVLKAVLCVFGQSVMLKTCRFRLGQSWHAVRTRYNLSRQYSRKKVVETFFLGYHFLPRKKLKMDFLTLCPWFLLIQFKKNSGTRFFRITLMKAAYFKPIYGQIHHQETNGQQTTRNLSTDFWTTIFTHPVICRPRRPGFIALSKRFWFKTFNPFKINHDLTIR